MKTFLCLVGAGGTGFSPKLFLTQKVGSTCMGSRKEGPTGLAERFFYLV